MASREAWGGRGGWERAESPSPNSAPDFQCDLGLRFPICQKGLPLFTPWGWLVWGLAAEKGKA